MILRSTPDHEDVLEIENWVMSCRVFGRQLEFEAMNIAVEAARQRGARAFIADYIATSKNKVIRALYPSLGFAAVNRDGTHQRDDPLVPRSCRLCHARNSHHSCWSSTMTVQEILTVFTRILRDLLLDDSIVLTMETRREDIPNWDSFNYINFIVAVEIEFGVKFKVADIESFANVGAIVTEMTKALA